MLVLSRHKESRMNRRLFMGNILLGSAALAAGGMPSFAYAYEVTKTDAEWKAQLSPLAYKVLRHADTEMPFTSPLDKVYAKGTYSCAGCNRNNFSSDTKFNSRTGWPSFYKPLNNAVLEREDDSDGDRRTEIHCARCGGHLGHVFADGP